MARLPNRPVVEYILDLAGQNRPREWIARRVGVSTRDVTTVLRVAGLKNMQFRKTLEEYDLVEAATQDQWSVSEICRTYGWTPGTVKR